MPRVSVELFVGVGQATEYWKYFGKLWKPNWIMRGILCRTRGFRHKGSMFFLKNVILVLMHFCGNHQQL